MGVSLKVFYGGDFSVKGYRDREFGASFSWDTDLLGGYESSLLCEDLEKQPIDYETVTKHGVEAVLDREKPDAVLVMGYSHPFDRAALFGAIKRKLPLFYRGEANDTAIHRPIWKRSIRRLFLKYIYFRCRRLLYIGEEARRHYEKHGVSNEKLFFSPYCVDISSFKSGDAHRSTIRIKARDELSIKDGEKVILYSGKFSHRKGVDLLLIAAGRCPSNTVLLFVGDGELRTELEKQSGNDARVIFTGFQNQQKLSKFYHAADILALPSRHSETWGLVVNEALAHGLPAVVSDAVGCRWDLIRPGITGEIAMRDDADMLVDALRRCLKYAGTATTRKNCREIVGPYNIDSAAQGIFNAYKSVVRKVS
ncbi:D-inositol 3-phosphate glycosyltransferase [bacterium BMS3Bbin11]|nr:D-inositol 3-phosphate glycosyltransferase [bacterium BMS3Bbin11]